jgi:hypothetical protein
VQREVQPDAKHQENDTDFGELQCEGLIRDVPGRKGSDDHAGDDIADQKGNTQSMGQRAEDEGKAKANNNGGDQVLVGHHHLCWGPPIRIDTRRFYQPIGQQA